MSDSIVGVGASLRGMISDVDSWYFIETSKIGDRTTILDGEMDDARSRHDEMMSEIYRMVGEAGIDDMFAD